MAVVIEIALDAALDTALVLEEVLVTVTMVESMLPSHVFILSVKKIVVSISSLTCEADANDTVNDNGPVNSRD
jgi:hypothetical protein